MRIDKNFWRAFFTKKIVRVCFAILVLFVLAAVFADLLAPYDPNAGDLKARLADPSAAHPFGTDYLGRDQLSRMIYGARIAMLIAASSVLISGTIGMILGLIAGFFGGIVDDVIMRVADAWMAIPGIILTLAVTTALGQSTMNVIIAIGISSIPPHIRMMRSKVLSVKERDYVMAARVLGEANGRSMRRHVLTNSLSPMIISFAMGMAGAIMSESTLSFLGVGVPSPTASWGSMVSAGLGYLTTKPHVALIPGLAIMIVVLSCNIVADALRDALDPRIKGAVA